MIETPRILNFSNDIVDSTVAAVKADLNGTRVEEISFLNARDRAMSDLFGQLLGKAMSDGGELFGARCTAGYVAATRIMRLAAGNVPLPPHTTIEVQGAYAASTKRPTALDGSLYESYGHTEPVQRLLGQLTNDQSRFTAKLVLVLDAPSSEPGEHFYEVSRTFGIPKQRSPQQRHRLSREAKRDRARYGHIR